MSITFNPSVSAMNAVGQGFNAYAHNVANVNTDNFNPLQVTYTENTRTQNANEAGQSTVQANIQAPTLLNIENEPVPSNTEVSREMVNMINAENTYAVNAKVISTEDEMIGNFLNNLA